jgi:hypothetical protein
MSFETVFKKLAAAALLVAVTGFAGSAVQAATMIDFEGDKKADPYMEDGFSFGPNRIVNGNCLSGQCAALNNNETMVMTNTLPTAGSPFTLNSLNFNLLGKGTGNTLTVTGSNAAAVSFSVPTYANNSYHFFDFGTTFENVTAVTFSTNNGGNVRIDDVMVTTAPVPLPAAAWLLIGGIGALGAAARRRRTQTA